MLSNFGNILGHTRNVCFPQSVTMGALGLNHSLDVQALIIAKISIAMDTNKIINVIICNYLNAKDITSPGEY